VIRSWTDHGPFGTYINQLEQNGDRMTDCDTPGFLYGPMDSVLRSHHYYDTPHAPVRITSHRSLNNVREMSGSTEYYIISCN